MIGERAYSTWTEDGLYPAMGFHTRGEMGGIWSPPIKLLDGLWFGVDGQWLGDDVEASRFSSGWGYGRTDYAASDGVRVSRHRLRAGRSACAAGRPDAAERQRHDGSAGGGRALRADGDLPVGRDDSEPAGGQRRRHGKRRRLGAGVPRAGRRRPSARGARLGGRGRERPHAGVHRARTRLPRTPGPRGRSARPPARPTRSRNAATTRRTAPAPAVCSGTTSRCRRTRP